MHQPQGFSMKKKTIATKDVKKKGKTKNKNDEENLA